MKKIRLSFFVLVLFLIGSLQVKAQFVPEADGFYFIQSAEPGLEGQTIGDYDLPDGYVSVGEFTGAFNQLFKFVPTGEQYETNDLYRLQVQSTGEYFSRKVGSNAWVSEFSAEETTSFWIDNSLGNGIIYLTKFYATENRSHLAAMDANDPKIYLDKNKSHLSKWQVVKATDEQLLTGAKAFLAGDFIPTAKTFAVTLPSALQTIFNGDIAAAEAAAGGADKDVMLSAIATIREKMQQGEAFMQAINTAKKTLQREGDFSAGATEKQALEAAIAAAEGAADFSQLTTLTADMETAIAAYLATEVKPKFTETIQEGTYYRLFSGDFDNLAYQFAYLMPDETADSTKNNLGVKHQVFEGAQESDVQFFYFQFLTDSTFNIVSKIDNIRSNTTAEKRLMRNRGSGGSGMQVQVTTGRVNQNDTKWLADYVETKDGVQYFTFRAMSGANHMFFGNDGTPGDMKTLSGYNKPPKGETEGAWKIALLEEGKVFKAVLANEISKAEDVLASTTSGTELGQYPASSRTKLQNTVNTAKGIFNNAGATQEEVNKAAESLQKAVARYESDVNLVGGIKGVTEVEEGTLYYIRAVNGGTSAGLLMGDYGGGADGAVTLGAPTFTDNQKFEFIPTGNLNAGNDAVLYTLQVQTEEKKFIYGTSWKSEFAAEGSAYWIDPVAAEGVVYIKNSGKSDGLGLDNNNPHVYLNKSGNNAKWMILEATDDVQLLLALGDLQSKLLAAKDALDFESEWGFPAETREALEASVAAANELFQSTDMDAITEGAADLKAKTKAYKDSEQKPRFNAIPGAKYRIKITQNEGIDFRYITYVVESDNKVLPRPLDETAETSEYQMFYLEQKEGGEIDEYYIKNVASGKYLDSWGERFRPEQTMSWVANYNKEIEDVYYFTIQKPDGARWGIDGGIFPDAVNNMYYGKNGHVYTIEFVPPTTTALEAALTEANAFAELTADSIGTTDKLYPQEARDAFEAVITAAQDVLDNSKSQIAVNETAELLSNALATYKAAKIIVDRSALETKLAEAQAIHDEAVEGEFNGQYPAGSKAELKVALDAAMEMFEKEDVIQTNIDESTTALNTAITDFKLKVIVINFEDLDAVIVVAEAYTDDMNLGETDLVEALKTYNAVIAKANALDRTQVKQEDVAAMVEELNAAMDTLEAAYVAFLAENLTTLIAEAQAKHDAAVEGTEPGNYKEGSKATLKTAIDAAQTFVDAADRSSDFAAEKATLEAAIKAFEAAIVVDEGDGIDVFAANGINIYSNDGKLFITGLTSEVLVSVYDMSGKAVMNEKASANEYVCELASGNYVISLQGYVNGSKVVLIK